MCCFVEVISPTTVPTLILRFFRNDCLPLSLFSNGATGYENDTGEDDNNDGDGTTGDGAMGNGATSDDDDDCDRQRQSIV